MIKFLKDWGFVNTAKKILCCYNCNEFGHIALKWPK